MPKLFLRIGFIVLFQAVFLCAHGTNNITFTPNCLDAQGLIYQLRLSEANTLLKKEALAQPSNVATDYLQTIRLMLRFIIDESPQAVDSFYKQKEIAFARIEECGESNGYKDFLLEEIYFYSSVVNGKQGNNLSAANDVRNAYKHGTRVIKNYPKLKAAQKTIGLLNAGLGSLPTTYQKMVNFFGYEASMSNGISLVEEFIKAEKQPIEMRLIQMEAKFYLASIYLHLKNDKVKAWQQIDEITTDCSTNPLSAFARIHFADKCKKNDEIIKTFNKYPKASPYEKIPFLNYMMGKACLQKLDSTSPTYFHRYIANQKGASYVKSSYQKLAWFHQIQGNMDSFYYFKKKILSAPKSSLEEDEQADKFAKTTSITPTNLVKTRLLFDGGYYHQALHIIRPAQASDFHNKEDKTEYFYRKGRIYNAINKDNLAIAFYLEAIREGEPLTTYYASYACLYLAEIYEKQGDKANAKVYFQKATTFSNNKEYRNSIEHRAKNGLKRIEINDGN